MPVLRKIVCAMAWTGLAASLTIYLLSWFGINIYPPLRQEFMLVLALALFPVWGYTVMKYLRTGKLPPFTFNIPKYAKERFPFLPAHWAVSIQGILIFYILNFILFVIWSDGGGPDIINGQYALTDHGRLIRYISRDEYEFYLANEMRLFSGTMLTFYVIATIYGCVAAKIEQPDKSSLIP